MNKRIFISALMAGPIITAPFLSIATDRPKDIPAWDSLDDKQKKMYARQMEALAGQLEHVDMEIGRMIATLERTGELDNNLQTELDENLEHYDHWGSEETNGHYHAG